MEIHSEQTENDVSRVLVVDDNPEIREILHILLGGEGYEIKEAKSGADALKITKEQQFDLIILDIMMPDMDGYHTCMELIKTVWGSSGSSVEIFPLNLQMAPMI